MFRREAHQHALAVLEALDGELLARTATLFAGGTRLALDFDPATAAGAVGAV